MELVRTTVLLAGLALTLGVPATASATRYVDDGGSNADNGCTDQGAPCQAINYAIAQSATGETIVVAPGTYNESVTLVGNRSLQHTGSGASIVDGGAGPALQVNSAGTVNGFTLRSTGVAARLQGRVTLTGNTFDSPLAPNTTALQLLTGAGGSQVSGNTFADPGGLDYQIALQIQNVSLATTISDNAFSGFGAAIVVQGSRPRITGNTITGTHALAAFPGIGILIQNDAVPVVFSNLIRAPGAGQAIGIWVAEDGTTVQGTGADIERTRILGHDPGVLVDDATGGVYLFSDLIAKSPGQGLIVRDNAPTGTGEGDVRARNVTVWGGTSPPDIMLQDVDLQLDSSIVGAGGISRTTTGSHCSITFSRGPVRGSDECGDFDYVASPLFVNSGAGDYHLAPGSPMVEAGNPSSPAVGAQDIDGDPRAIDGDRDCEVRRDIGADEFSPQLAGCVLPYQTRTLRTRGRDFKLRIFGPRGGNYTACVRGPRRIEGRLLLCHGFRMRQVRPGLYEDVVGWGSSFRFMGKGTYQVSWYQPGARRLLGPRKTFSTSVCPPQPQLMDGVWKPHPRLRVVIPCYTVSGVVTSRHGFSSNDGDYLFGFNTTRGRNFSHAELVPRDRGHTRRGRGRGPQEPRTGERLRLTGVFVCDGFHGPLGHHEIHPVFKIVYPDRGGRVATSGPQYGGTPRVGLRFPGWHPCP